MKRTLLTKMMLLLCALVAGSSSVWADNTVTWSINGVTTAASGGSDVNTTLKTSSVSPDTEKGVWTAVASKSYAGTSSGAQLGSGSYTFAGTITLSGTNIPSTATIKSIGITLSSTGTNYKIDATVGGNAFGSQVSVNQTDSKNYTFTDVEDGNDIVLTFSNGGKKNVKITAISVTYADLAASDFAITSATTINLEKPSTTTSTITYSTSSDGTISFVSADESVATVADNGDGTATVTAVGSGSTTITASQAMGTSYKASGETEITVNVSDASKTTKPTIAVSPSVIDEATDVSITITGAGTIYYTTDGTTPVVGTSSIATSGTPFVVNLAATTTIKALAKEAGKDASDVAEEVVTLKVQNKDVTATFNYEFLGLASAETRITEKTTKTQDGIDFIFDKISGSNWPQGDAAVIRLYSGTTLEIKSPSGYAINSITFTANGDWKSGMSANIGTYNDTKDKDEKTYWTGVAQSVTFSPSGTHRIATVNVKLVKVVDVTITSAGWASFSNAKALDFTDTDVTAYIAKVKDASTMSLSPINKVPAATGIVISADAGTYAIPVLDGAADATTGNMLKPNLTPTTLSSDYYTLAVDGENKPIFKKSSGSGKLAAGKAYLDLTGGAPELKVDFGQGGTTSLREMRNVEGGMSNVFNLAGQRVATPTKGLYIVNGKKVVIK